MNELYEVGDLVKIDQDNDNDNYDEFRGKTLRITGVSTSVEDHPGYDEGLEGQGLYDLETEDGEDVPFSLYDFELENA